MPGACYPQLNVLNDGAVATFVDCDLGAGVTFYNAGGTANFQGYTTLGVNNINGAISNPGCVTTQVAGTCTIHAAGDTQFNVPSSGTASALRTSQGNSTTWAGTITGGLITPSGAMLNAGIVTAAVRNVTNYNPVGASVPGAAFSIAGSGLDWTNTTGVDGMLYCKLAGTVTSVRVNGVSLPIALAVGDSFRVPVGGTWGYTGSSAPTMVFVGD
jgi:hypothetical protein